MKEVLGSLPEVITAYKNYNLLVPTATDVQLNPFYKFHVEEVPVDLGETSGDIFKVGSVKTGKQDERGKDIWEDVFSLSKPLLNKMAMAAGIQFNPKETYGERIDRVTYRAQAQGAMRKADGTARTETDQKVICLEDEEEKYRIEFADKAAKGITDEKQAQAAAEIFSGQWVESKNKWGKKCQAFVVAKEDRDRYIDRSVMVNMALLKKTWAEKAMTGAKLRVIRALLGVKGTYTKAELQKNFAIPTVIFSPDFSDPQVRQAMLTQGMNSVNNMFGTPQIAVKNVDFESESTVFTQDDLDNPAYASDTESEDDYPPMQEPDIAPEPESEPEPDRSMDFQCSRYIDNFYCSLPLGDKFHGRTHVANQFKNPENIKKFWEIAKLINKSDVSFEIVFNTDKLTEEDFYMCRNELEKHEITVDKIAILDKYYELVSAIFPNVKLVDSVNNMPNTLDGIRQISHKYDEIVIGRQFIRNTDAFRIVTEELGSDCVLLVNNGCSHICGGCQSFDYCNDCYEKEKNRTSAEYLYALQSILPYEISEEYFDTSAVTVKIIFCKNSEIILKEKQFVCGNEWEEIIDSL